MSEFEIKERLAHSIFLKMMGEAGYNIKKLDYEGAAQDALKLKNVDYKAYLSDIITHRRDFLLVASSPLMLQVIFSEKEINPSDYDFPESLGGAIVVFITPFEPFFVISTIRDFCSDGMIYPLAENPFFDVPRQIILKYSRMVEDRLK